MTSFDEKRGGLRVSSPSFDYDTEAEALWLRDAVCGGIYPEHGMRIHMPNREDRHPSGVLLGPPERWLIYDYSRRKAYSLEAIWPDWRERLKAGKVPAGNYVAKSSGSNNGGSKAPITAALVRDITDADVAQWELATGIPGLDRYRDRLTVVTHIIREGKVRELPFCIAAVAPDGTLFKGYLPQAQSRHLLLSRHLTYIPFHAGPKTDTVIYAKNIKDAIALAEAGYVVYLKASEGTLVPDAKGYQQVDNDEAGQNMIAAWRKVFPDVCYVRPRDRRFKDISDMYAATRRMNLEFIQPYQRKRIK
ncbi:MAG: hypothetical protein D6790_20340 [Caldilineae bacterium]|nr:MAG: hypothetical protein D6790_20340 [Caldilineae bacterium]